MSEITITAREEIKSLKSEDVVNIWGGVKDIGKNNTEEPMKYSTLSWKTHIDQLNSKLHSACYIIKSLRSIISTKNFRIVYFSYLHSIIAYGIIFWGNSP
jgi:hypothetical protein